MCQTSNEASGPVAGRNYKSGPHTTSQVRNKYVVN